MLDNIFDLKSVPRRKEVRIVVLHLVPSLLVLIHRSLEMAAAAPDISKLAKRRVASIYEACWITTSGG